MKEKLYTVDDVMELLRMKDVLTIKLDQAGKQNDALRARYRKLRNLLLLTDPAVKHVPMNELTVSQWAEYTKCFPSDTGDE